MTVGFGCVPKSRREFQARARAAQVVGQRSLSRAQRKARMACAPVRLQRMPACLSRAWTTTLQADSTAPLPMGSLAWRKLPPMCLPLFFLVLPSSCQPANAPGSPAGERQHRIKLDENTWPKEWTSHGPSFRRGPSGRSAAGCWPAYSMPVSAAVGRLIDEGASSPNHELSVNSSKIQAWCPTPGRIATPFVG